MAVRNQIELNLKGAALFSAAFVVLLGVGWIFIARVQAQASLQIQGQVLNGTRDASPNSLGHLPITLFQITQAGPVTRTAETDTAGKFLFTNIITDASAYFARVDYSGIRYFSDILPAELAASSPLTVTVYETQTLPANLTVDRVHLILDVQAKRLNGLQLVQITPPPDRAFLLPLPLPENASTVQFEDPREQSRLKRDNEGTVWYPILPTTSEVLYSVVLPFSPPEYHLQLPLKYNVAGLSLLVSKTGDVVVTGNNLVRGEPFTAQGGQEYLVFAAPEQRAGTTFRATLSNLPGIDNTPRLQTVVLIVGGLGGLALLAYPVYRRRANQNKPIGANPRIEQLQSLAQLDDAFDAGELDEEEYRATRASLKAELLKLPTKDERRMTNNE